jgi:hypothetical protein
MLKKYLQKKRELIQLFSKIASSCSINTATRRACTNQIFLKNPVVAKNFELLHLFAIFAAPWAC